MPTPDKLGSTRLVAAVPGAVTAVLLVGTSVTIREPVSGTTYHVRLQVIRATATGKMVVAQTDVLTWPAP